MPRSIKCLLIVAGAALAIGWALLAPVHFRSVDERVLDRVNRRQPRTTETALRFTNKTVAALISRAAGQLQLARRQTLTRHVDYLPLHRPQVWHLSIDPVEPLITSFIVNPGQKLTEVRKTNNTFEASVVLRTVSITNLAHFSPAGTASGQPYEASVLITAALLKAGAGTPELQSSILQMIGRGDVPEIESFYLDILALARRFNWEQTVFLLDQFTTLEGLAQFAEVLRHFADDLPVLFTTAALASDAAQVAAYVMQFGVEGIRDLELALGHGPAALDRLVQEKVPVWSSAIRDRFLLYEPFYSMYRPLLALAVNWPALTLILKYALIFFGGFLLAISLKFTSHHLENELGYHWFSQMRLVRQVLFGLMTIMLVLALGEPYLAQGEQKVELMPKISLSVAPGNAAPPGPINATQPNQSMLDQYSIVALVLFFVLQGIIYLLCLLKLGEIRRQPLTSALKLRLLDNEENLFDSGLYVGLFGTIASLVLLTMGVFKPSLVAAYSSTLFGILFVAVLKIGHLRPYKRHLLLETESPNP